MKLFVAGFSVHQLPRFKKAELVILFCVAMTTFSPGQTFNTLVLFDGSNGAFPWYMSMVQGSSGDLYGTTAGGGSSRGYGTIFKITRDGKLTKLHNFDGSDGATPYSGLVKGPDGSAYGATKDGGNGLGTIFKVSPQGAVTSLYSFCSEYNCPDGARPWGALIRADNGTFYGTTWGGGGDNSGTIFKITPAGTFTQLHTFAVQDGQSVYSGLVQGPDGDFYGTTGYGGDFGWGTVFKVSPAGAVTTLYSFCALKDCPDGAVPYATLLLASDGNFYGTTGYGGTKGSGTVFRITPTGVHTILYNFCSESQCSDGAVPIAGLIEASDGNFYGTAWTSESASEGPGTLFRITPQGVLTTLHTFDVARGSHPSGGLVQATNGILYGTTDYGGRFGCNPNTHGCGTVFSFDVGLAPFVAFVRDSGKVGGSGGILGQGFTGTTNVAINGVPATFTVVSDTFLQATVPAGATTGFVTVTTPGGTLTSNRVFRVRPQLLSFDPPSGPVGTQVTITGISLTQTLAVGFGDRVPAQFTVNSDIQVTATVPAGAKTGTIRIETKGGIATTNGTFTVTP